jgi:hypothetical protein
MPDIKVEFPNPCSEPWEDMAPRGCHRHCAACDKVILDLAALSIDEAEALLNAADKVYVRAQIGPDGVVAIKPAARPDARRMMAVMGGSLALATAACQTVPSERTSRFAISGEISPIFAQMLELRASDGKKQRKTHKHGTSQYVFGNLKPGTYTLLIRESCGIERRVETVTIIDQSVTVTAKGPAEEIGDDDPQCEIIVGVMRPARRPWPG